MKGKKPEQDPSAGQGPAGRGPAPHRTGMARLREPVIHFADLGGLDTAYMIRLGWLAAGGGIMDRVEGSGDAAHQ